MMQRWGLASALLCMGCLDLGLLCCDPGKPGADAGARDLARADGDGASSDLSDSAQPDLTFVPTIYDVGLVAGKVAAVKGRFGGLYPVASKVCAMIGINFTPITSAAVLDMSKVMLAGGWYFANVRGTFNIGTQQTSCSQLGTPEDAFMGAGSKGIAFGIKSTLPAPCSGFSLAYACGEGAIECGSAPSALDQVVNPLDYVGLFCGSP